jgi:phosphatidylserine decarboxylase
MISFFKTNLLFSQGRNVLYSALGLILVTYFVHVWLFVAVLGFLAFCLYFFRNPERKAPSYDLNILLAPSDGRVVAVEYSDDKLFDGFEQRVSIFLSPLDVHVNWIPMAGHITTITYKTGKFCFAFVPKSSELNERNDIVLTDEYKRTIVVRQIAGTVARRIVWWVREGERVQQGQKYGMIKFGSRVDILLPKNVHVQLVEGQRVYGGYTVVGKWIC